MKANRYGVTVSAQAGEQLKELQKGFERRVGFEPSLAQVVEYLISREYYNSVGEDKVTDSKNV
jgi:hypothetical protein